MSNRIALRSLRSGPYARPIPALDFKTFYHSHYRSVVGLGYILGGSHAVAEDLAQEAFAEAHRRWDDISGYDNPGAWVRRVMVNRSRSRLRRIQVEAKALTRLGRAREVLVDLPESSEEIWAAVRSLPQRQAQAIALRYWDDMGVAEIAEVLDCGPETVKTHLKRGRAALADRLGRERGVEDDR